MSLHCTPKCFLTKSFKGYLERLIDFLVVASAYIQESKYTVIVRPWKISSLIAN